MSEERSVLAVASLREFFKERLEWVMRRQQLRLAQNTEFYLVNLLSEFVEVDKLFAEDGERGKEAEPLALLYARAQQQEREACIRTLRRLGDVSLYQTGFFAQSVRESPVGEEYYVQMGEAAYGQIAAMTPASGFGHVYWELGQKFRNVSAVLEEISAAGMAASGPNGALHVYEAWARTGNEGLARVLVDVGLIDPKRGLPN
ncbi:MAG: hypothetical protein ACKVPX_00725 [Myxococcaceae bacterium]